MPLMTMERKSPLGTEPETSPPKHTLSGSSDRDFIIDLWYRFQAMEHEMTVIREQAKMTNGRVSKLEKFMWLSFGVAMAATVFASSIAIRVSVM